MVNFSKTLRPQFAVRRKAGWPVKVVRAGASGNGFVREFREVGWNGKTMTRVEGSL
ncbi:hypothetical protein [Prolixibacter bellariivorans]|uniref:hypothetical protein n=1 Tax=Prolixibacter bellariivorans TaxID=314319 RepID=UPI00131F1351|nr:hypothetical protein [Prolixibacter bellariivorans]